MRARMYARVVVPVRAHVWAWVCMRERTRACMHVRMRVCVCARMGARACMSVRMRAHAGACDDGGMNVRLRERGQVCMRVLMDVWLLVVVSVCRHV